MWETDPAGMRLALAAHDQMVRAAVAAHDGYVFSTGGDGLAVAFARAGAAVNAAVGAQRALGAWPWPPAVPLRVRMGIATGEAEERDGDYFGPVLNRAARVMAAGHGGQILLAGVTAGLVDGVELVDLGVYRLRDLSGRSGCSRSAPTDYAASSRRCGRRTRCRETCRCRPPVSWAASRRRPGWRRRSGRIGW